MIQFAIFYYYYYYFFLSAIQFAMILKVFSLSM